MRALVLEGGAMRAVFTCGVLDGFAERGEPAFDRVIGVSAGAACATSFLAGQHGRNRRVFIQHMTTPVFVNPWRALRGGSFFDMSFVMGPLPLDLDPLDFDALRGSPSQLEAVACRADTGEPAYLPAQGTDCLEALLASVAIPVLYRPAPVRFRGRDYFDGGVVDPIPVHRALTLGADDIAVVTTHPRSWRPKPQSGLERLLLHLTTSSWPALRDAARQRRLAYERALDALQRPPGGVRIRTYYPPEEFRVTRYTRDPQGLTAGYQQGLAAGLQADGAN